LKRLDSFLILIADIELLGFFQIGTRLGPVLLCTESPFHGEIAIGVYRLFPQTSALTNRKEKDDDQANR